MTPQRFTVAYFACHCAITCIPTSHPDCASLASLWRDRGYIVRELSHAEINAIRCYTPHTTGEMEEMGRIQKVERERTMGMGVQS